MATNKNDLKQIREVVREELGNQEQKFEAKLTEELGNQEQKYESKLTEFKSEFFEKIDPILQEVKTARDERPLIINRVEKLERIHPQGKHSIAI
ncbi:hypothetical protein A2159_03825 [Candidatus Woesebacteria bacterium RBG_13_34_9]|uniref:Uncharacterized protein n=1 Tax=Candidatus Woesebacteria bacterium RBG_13_34_9 TaxID=1802477 RepID=A0A1F7WYQ9_9BACT|nr:MAG: hypothetical protein A2159_03825 [Candidatus Woesebacteria bacterium RBG_13_34_9]